MFESFCLRLACGLVFSLLLLPPRVVNSRFFRIHLLIVLGLSVAAGVASWSKEAGDLYWLALGLGLGVSFVGTWCWSLEGAPGGYAALCLSAAAFAAALLGWSMYVSKSSTSVAWLLLDDLTAAGLLGTTTTAMLMGHWYLIAPTMSLQPLLRVTKAIFVSTGLRILVAAAGLAFGIVRMGDLETWVWLPLRWAAGLAGPLVLGWMAWQSARIRSTQSATGILYVVVVLTFVGELTDLVLHGSGAISAEASHESAAPLP